VVEIVCVVSCLRKKSEQYSVELPNRDARTLNLEYPTLKNTRQKSLTLNTLRYGTVRLPPLLARSTGPCTHDAQTRIRHSAGITAHKGRCTKVQCNTIGAIERFRSQRRPRERPPFVGLAVRFAPCCSRGERSGWFWRVDLVAKGLPLVLVSFGSSPAHAASTSHAFL
jgi:hypothetical protein